MLILLLYAQRSAGPHGHGYAPRPIAKVYEVDPMVCDRCGSPMRILAIITDPQEVKKILHHLARAGKPPPGLGASSLN